MLNEPSTLLYFGSFDIPRFFKSHLKPNELYHRISLGPIYMGGNLWPRVGFLIACIWIALHELILSNYHFFRGEDKAAMDFAIFGNKWEEFLFLFVICTIRDQMQGKLMKDFLPFRLLNGYSFNWNRQLSLGTNIYFKIFKRHPFNIQQFLIPTKWFLLIYLHFIRYTSIFLYLNML